MWAFQPPQFPHLCGDGDTHHSTCLGVEKLHFVQFGSLCCEDSGCIWQDHASRQKVHAMELGDHGLPAHRGHHLDSSCKIVGVLCLPRAPPARLGSAPSSLAIEPVLIGLVSQSSLSLQSISMVASSWLSRSSANSPSVLPPVLKTLPLTQQVHCQQFT